MLAAIAFLTFLALGGVVSAWLSAAAIRRLGLPWRETLVWFGILLEPEISLRR